MSVIEHSVENAPEELIAMLIAWLEARREET
jgi:hypothetical protein